ncbi:MAG TPA: hypothetical protein ENK44_07045 [Caldithrix abyssi]|uniref:LTD domain-containing protein n=1 Tax=Caldithrix abyssi TaxID=187145 RepID=A0A7V4U197_CALAY|nr:hypothetical protein [Caldithrix abyssi]
MHHFFLRHLLFILLLVLKLNAQITFSEVMFDVVGSDAHDEFIEIYNLSSTETVDLSGWRLSDSLAEDRLTDAGSGLLLKPEQFAVILDGSYWENSDTYQDVIPDEALILTIDDKALGSGGLTNSKGKLLSLIDGSGAVVDSYRYSPDNMPGYSDEKIMLSVDNSAENWANSAVLGGTPGYRNSVTPYDYDIGFATAALSYHPALAYSLQPIQIEGKASNLGVQNFQAPLHILLFIDSDENGQQDADEEVLIDSDENIDLPVGEVFSFSAQWVPRRAGRYRLAAQIESAADENSVNNTTSVEIPVVESLETVSINEIKFLTFDGEPEWIELLNNGERPLTLQDWAIADSRDTCRIDSLLYLYPGQYKIIAADSGLARFYPLDDSLIFILKKLPTLNNDKDVVYLLNPAGGWVEQAPYNVDWLEGEEWRKPSLERIYYKLDPRSSLNWGPSTDKNGATPGRQNSLFTAPGGQKGSLQIEPNPFSPDGDGFEDHALITVHSATAASRLRADIFDITGRKIRTLQDNVFSGSNAQLVWNGRDDSGTKVRMGIYVVFVQLLDDRSGVLQEMKETVVVAGRLE